MKNNRNGKRFEVLIRDKLNNRLPHGVTCERIIRANYSTSDCDLYIHHRTGSLKIDCKFTINSFSDADIQRLWQVAQNKYGECLLILGERKGSKKLSPANIYCYDGKGQFTLDVLADMFL